MEGCLINFIYCRMLIRIIIFFRIIIRELSFFSDKVCKDELFSCLNLKLKKKDMKHFSSKPSDEIHHRKSFLLFSLMPGYYCIPSLSVAGDPSSAKNLCPEGFFCPNGTGHDWQACPAGTFSSATGLRSADECTPCLAGEFCQG